MNDYRPRLAKNEIDKSLWEKLIKEVENSGGIYSYMQQPNLKTVKQTLDKNGNVNSETLSIRESNDVDTSLMEVLKVTTCSLGYNWITYKPNQLDKIKVLDRLNERYKDFKPPSYKIEYPKHQKNVAVLNLYDAHLDKVALKSETGEQNDLQSNVARFKNAFDSLLEDVKQKGSERIIFPIGNDLFHTNGMNGKTKKGTDLQYMASPEDAYYIICDTIIECINKAIQIAPVYIPFVKGNHDEDKINILAFWIDRFFSNNEYVEVNMDRTQRKSIQYGDWLLSFAHGDKEKRKINDLPLLIAQENPKLWAATTKRKMYCGDLHHGFEYKFLKSKDFIGFTVEYLRSIGCSDKYHVDNGWLGVPKSAYVMYHSFDGLRESKTILNF